MGQYGTGLGGPDKTGLDGPVRNWAWWASTKLGLVASTKLGLVGQTKLGLMVQYRTGLGGPVRNWAWWASTKLGLMVQYRAGLGGQYETGLRGPDKTRLGGHIGLSYEWRWPSIWEMPRRGFYKSTPSEETMVEDVWCMKVLTHVMMSRYLCFSNLMSIHERWYIMQMVMHDRKHVFLFLSTRDQNIIVEIKIRKCMNAWWKTCYALHFENFC